MGEQKKRILIPEAFNKKSSGHKIKFPNHCSNEICFLKCSNERLNREIDRQYYPNPEQFNPDNFSERNKNSRPPYTFLAFGEGQKICIGNNFLSNISKIHARSLCYDDKYWWQNSLFYFYFLFFTQP